MISDKESIEIARGYALKQSWPWDAESVTAVLNNNAVWCVATRVDDSWVANVYVDVDAQTGKIVDGSYRTAVVHPISREAAHRIGKAICDQNGWGWDDVVIEEDEFATDDKRRINCWTIGTNRCRLGGNATIIIDAESGEVLWTSFASR